MTSYRRYKRKILHWIRTHPEEMKFVILLLATILIDLVGTRKTA